MPPTEHSTDPHVQANLEVIRTYLREHFEGFELMEKLEGSVCHRFEMVNLHKRFKLAVSGHLLSDHNYAPEQIRELLIDKKVAERMKRRPGEDFFWGWEIGVEH